MTATAYLNSDDLRSFEIDSLVVEFEVQRMDQGHVAGPIEEIVEIGNGSESDLKELAEENGYDDMYEYIFCTFEHELNEVALDEGPQLEADAYSTYMDRKYHMMKDEGRIR